MYYDHWVAHDLGNHLTLGPEYMLRYILQQERVNGWMDDVWAQGGLTMRLRDRRLVWYDMTTNGCSARRRLLTALLARTWPGWTVEWAYGGQGDVAEAAGVPRAQVRNSLVDDFRPTTPGDGPGIQERPEGSGRWFVTDDAAPHHLVTVTSGETTSASLVGNNDHPVQLGMAAVTGAWSPAVHSDGADSLELDGRTLTGGVHLDRDRRRLSYWTSFALLAHQDRVPLLWPGCEVRFLGDRVEEHLALAGGLVTGGLPDAAGEIAALAEGLARTHVPDRVHPGVQAMQLIESLGAQFSHGISPAIMDHHPPGPTAQELAFAVEQLAGLQLAPPDRTPGRGCVEGR